MKITLSRIFETSKALATSAGQELGDFIDFTAQMSEQVLRALRNGLTFEDNVRCLSQRVTFTSGQPQVVSTSGKLPTRVLATRVYSFTNGLAGFLWYVDGQNRLTVRCTFDNTPGTNRIDVDLLIFYE